ncbi:glycosyltransferase family 4 protein [Silvibacterium sp.]|uniref:glycosyltransferase family 4 protein n=1 Tax=Silvibacterium sp. TaxID=1964179 RepID=UPI0039E62FFB
MKILLLNQFFWPDSSPTSQLLTDVARELAEQGHEVFAICADGHYAPSAEEHPPRATIYRVRSTPFVRGVVGRVLSYASFYISACWRSFRMPRPDLVISLTTPPLLSLLGNGLSLLCGSRHFIWEMDMYPDVAVDLGQFEKGGIADKMTGLLADWSRRHADGIIALGECMKERLIRRGISAERISVAQNWADSKAVTPLPFTTERNYLSLLYSGNFGMAHDADTILDTMRMLRADTRFQFLFVGGGVHHTRLKVLAEKEGLHSVHVKDYVPRAELGQSLSAADIGLVTQRDQCCGSVVPSKVYALLAAARPILFIGPDRATPARLIREYGCGWHVPCGAVDQLVQLLFYLSCHLEEVRSAGQRARQALVEYFDLPLGVARIVQITGTQNMAVRKHDTSMNLGAAISSTQSPM